MKKPDVLEATVREFWRWKGDVTFIPVAGDVLERMEKTGRVPTEDKPLEIVGIRRREDGLLELVLRNPEFRGQREGREDA